MTSRPDIYLDTRVVAAGEQVACDVGDETVVLSLKDGVYYGLNSVAAFVWRLIQKETTVDALRSQMIQEFEVDPEVCTEDLRSLLVQLSDWRLVEISNGKRDDSSLIQSEGALDRS